jgi:hypothetical protein
MVTQWHPIFAQLLRPLVESHYEVRTGVPVGDAPREADLVLLRRTSVGPPPFTGLWRWLAPWNVLEFKGPTVSARLADLDALLELGLGIHRRLNEDRAQQRQARVDRPDVAFWYLANHLGRRFLRDAQGLLGPLEALGAGVWRAPLMGRAVVLVSGRTVPVDRDSLPVHVLAVEPEEHKRQLGRVLEHNRDLWPAYGPWLASAFPALAKEIAHMGRTKSKKFAFDFRPFIQEVGWKAIIEQTGLKSFVEEVGFKPLVEEVGLQSLVEEVGLDKLVAQLTPQQRQELQGLLQQTPPPPEDPGDSTS